MADIRKYTRSKGTKWQVRFKDPTTGKLCYKTFPRRKDADAFLADLDRRSYVHDSDTLSVSAAAERWLHVCETIGRKGREPVEASTLRKYREHADTIKSMIGGVMLNKLTPAFCDRFRDDLLAAYSRKQAKKILTSFKSILSQARSDGRMRYDPAENTAIIVSSRYEKSETAAIPTIEEVGTLLRKAQEQANCGNKQMRRAWRRYAPFFIVLAYSGMRPCEAIGLPWKNVDFERGTIEVTQDATEDRKIGLPKSASSYRTIHMPAVAMTALKQWRSECPVSELDLVFPNWKGDVESHSNITNRGWYALQRACELVDVEERPALYPLKSLRHVRASLEIHNGATAKEVQMLMGHSTIKVTFDVYGHLFRDHEAERANRANAIAEQLSTCGGLVAQQ